MTVMELVIPQIPMMMKAEQQSYFNLVVENADGWAKSPGRFLSTSMADTALIFLVLHRVIAHVHNSGENGLTCLGEARKLPKMY